MSHYFVKPKGLRTGVPVCKKCGDQYPSRRKCPGWPVAGKKKARLRKKKQPKPGKFNYRKSRFAVGDKVRSKEYGKVGVVAAHVRRKVRWREHNQWRQTPVIRFDGGKLQKVCDDTDLEIVDGEGVEGLPD